MSLQEARQKLRSELEAPAPLRAFGTGWISGVAGLSLSLIGLALVVSMRAPGQFAMPELTALHTQTWFKLGLMVILLLGFAASALSLALRPAKLLGTLGATGALLATLLGGSSATALTPDPTPGPLHLWHRLRWPPRCLARLHESLTALLSSDTMSHS